MNPERAAWGAGGAIIIVGALSRWANGFIYSQAEAMDLIESLASAALYFGAAMAGASATVLALMLTLVGLVRREDEEFDIPVYQRVAMISKLSAYGLAGSVVLLLALTMPIGEFEKMPANWYAILYNVLYALVIMLSALLVGTIVLLYQTVRALIAHITPSDDI